MLLHSNRCDISLSVFVRLWPRLVRQYMPRFEQKYPEQSTKAERKVLVTRLLERIEAAGGGAAWVTYALPFDLRKEVERDACHFTARAPKRGDPIPAIEGLNIGFRGGWTERHFSNAANGKVTTAPSATPLEYQTARVDERVLCGW